MSFGFSVGDFLSAAILIKDIAICLQGTRGSASDYQELVDELYGLQLALDKIQQLKESAEQGDEIVSLKAAALSCRPLLENFLKKIAPYGKSLDRGQSAGSVRDAKRKVQWELTMKTDCQNLRMYLQMHTASLNMRLSIAGLYVERSICSIYLQSPSNRCAALWLRWQQRR